MGQRQEETDVTKTEGVRELQGEEVNCQRVNEPRICSLIIRLLHPAANLISIGMPNMSQN